MGKLLTKTPRIPLQRPGPHVVRRNSATDSSRERPAVVRDWLEPAEARNTVNANIERDLQDLERRLANCASQEHPKAAVRAEFPGVEVGEGGDLIIHREHNRLGKGNSYNVTVEWRHDNKAFYLTDITKKTP